MKIMIVYSTHGGTTKTCADLLADKLREHHTVDFVDGRKENIPSPANYDAVVVGSSIRMGRMNKKLRRYIKENRAILDNMPFGIYFCCGYTKQFQEYVDIQFPKNYEPTLGFHLFGGEMKPERYKGIDKFIMRCMRDAIKTQDFEEDERRLHDLPEIYPENIAVLAKNISVALNNMQK